MIQPKPFSHVSELWRYPVKSMAGETCDALQCDLRGIAGDRLFAVRDADGKFGSGKNTRRFRKIDNLLQYRSRYVNEAVHIQFPDGRVLEGSSPEIHTALSDALGQPVTLAREAAVSHLDAGPIHVLTTAQLAWLRGMLPDAQVDARRFRPNLVIDTPGATLTEPQWAGMALHIGPEVVIQITAPTERCVMVTLAQGALPAEPEILRCIAQQAGLSFGVYARVVQAGVIRMHDAVVLAGQG